MKSILNLAVIGIVLVLGSITAGTGQDPLQPRFTTPVAEDHNCNSDHNFCHVNDLTDCVTVGFGGSGGVQGHLKVAIVCSGIQSAPCGGCLGCSYVRDTYTNTIVASNFTPNPCSTPCEGNQVNFQMENHWYELIVCLRACQNHNCDECNSSQCYASATVTAG